MINHTRFEADRMFRPDPVHPGHDATHILLMIVSKVITGRMDRVLSLDERHLPVQQVPPLGDAGTGKYGDVVRHEGRLVVVPDTVLLLAQRTAGDVRSRGTAQALDDPVR